MAAITAPVLRHDLVHRFPAAGQDVEPEQHRPQAILLADVVGAGAEALLTAEGDAARIQQVAEELPPGGGFKAGDAQLLGHHIGGGAGGHGTGHPRQAIAVAGHQGGVGGEHRQAVAGVHEAALPQDHVAVAVAIAGGPEAEAIAVEQQVRQLVGVGEVGVGMAAAEILQGGAVAHAARRCPQQTLQQPGGVGPRHRVHRIEGDGVVAPQQVADPIEIEQLLHQGDVVVDPIDHLHLQGADLLLAGLIERQRHRLPDAVTLQLAAAGVDGVGEGFRGGAAVGAIHLHAEIAIGATGVVAGREDDPGGGLVLADQVGGGRGREDAAGGGDDARHPMGRRHAGDHLNGAAVSVAAVTPHHQGAAGDAGHGAQDRFNEALQVVGGLELAAAFAQSRGAGLLVLKGLIKADLQHAAGHRDRPGGTKLVVTHRL